MIAVIADDITGAAEIAGIGLRFGLRPDLIMYTGKEKSWPPPADGDLLVIATDTRSMTEDEAIALTNRLSKALIIEGYTDIFKKTDSALRGHIVPELKVLMGNFTHFQRALLLPQNPSRQRIIEDGIYYINKVPLDQTSFAYDPEFPAHTSDVTDRLGRDVTLLTPEISPGKTGIYIANASTIKDVASYLSLSDAPTTLFAGGADLFTAFMEAKGYLLSGSASPFKGLGESSALIICGSTARHMISDYPYIRQKQIPKYSIPKDVFCGAKPDKWIESLKDAYRQHPSLIISIDQPPQKGKEVAIRLRETISKVTLSLLTEHSPEELIIEGGATAFTILSAVDWKTYHVEQEVSPGVIRISPYSYPQIHITLKPGSYSWGELFM